MFACCKDVPAFDQPAGGFPRKPLCGILEPPRVAVLLTGTRGDHEPMLPLLKQMKARGMQVKVFAKKSFAPLFHGADIGMVPLPGVDCEYIFTHETVRRGLGKSQLSGSLAIDSIMSEEWDEWGMIQALADGMIEFNPTVVLWHCGLVLEAVFSCKLCQCPSICLSPVPFAPTAEIPCWVMMPDQEPGWLAKQSYRVAFEYAIPFSKRKLYQRIHKEYGVLIGGADIYEMVTCNTRPMLCAWSPLLAPRCSDYPAGVEEPTGFLRWSDAEQKRAYAVPEALEEFVEGKSRNQLVFISWGSMCCGTDEFLSTLAVEALQKAGVDGILQSGYADLRLECIKDDNLRKWAEEHVYVAERGTSIPHNWLFPRCGVCVHHGGAGTVASCLYAGTPSIVTPVAFDQYHWGRRVEACGVGLRGPPLAQASATQLGELIRRALNNLTAGAQSMAAAAQAMGLAMQKEDGVTRASEFIESFCRGEWEPQGLKMCEGSQRSLTARSTACTDDDVWSDVERDI